MEERALFAIILSIIIIVLYQYLFIPKPVVKEAPLNEKEVVVAEKVEEDEEEIKGEVLENLIKVQEKRKEREYSVETDKYIMRISNKGGCLTEWKLKEYREEEKYETWPLKMAFWRQIGKSYMNIFKREEDDGEIRPLVDLVPETDLRNKGPLDIKLSSEVQGEERFGEGIYDVDEEEYLDSNNNRVREITMTFLDPQGILLEREMRFYMDSYKIDLNIRMRNVLEKKKQIDYSLFWGPGIGKGEEKSGHHRFVGPVFWIDGKKQRVKPRKIKETMIRDGKIDWIAFEETYFAAAIITSSEASAATIFKNKIGEEERVSIGVKYPARILDSGEEIIDHYEIYIGPKRKEDLEGITPNFAEIIDYGWFSFLARPLIWFLNLSYKYIPNYGIAIIILTIIIKILFWPLTEKSFGSMRDMQKIQPKMSALREKYKSDPAKMNKEIMDLYKKQGVNPLGGCLPMILQIPVFFALFEGLLVAIEMRGAPFMFWIKDLSAMDPLLITPVLMGVTMYIQQKMMPTGMDPKQAKMMNMMPVLFTVFFLGFPSGLVIYWLLNNVLTIGHQYLIQRRPEKAD